MVKAGEVWIQAEEQVGHCYSVTAAASTFIQTLCFQHDNAFYWPSFIHFSSILTVNLVCSAAAPYTVLKAGQRSTESKLFSNDSRQCYPNLSPHSHCYIASGQGCQPLLCQRPWVRCETWDMALGDLPLRVQIGQESGNYWLYQWCCCNCVSSS